MRKVVKVSSDWTVWDDLFVVPKVIFVIVVVLVSGLHACGIITQ